jgi:hypothetical protein
MAKLKFQQCNSCRSHAVRYRKDYPATDVRAYIIIHARGCNNLSAVQRHNEQHSTPAQLAGKRGLDK